MVTRQRVLEIRDDAKIIYGGTRAFPDALRSGLYGTLQKYGWTHDNRTTKVEVVRASIKVVIDHQPMNDMLEAKTSELGVMTFLGVHHLVQVFDATVFDRQICEEVLAELEGVEIATAGETLKQGPDKRRKSETKALERGIETQIGEDELMPGEGTAASGQSVNVVFHYAVASKNPLRTPVARCLVDEARLLYRAAAPESTMTSHQEQSTPSTSRGLSALTVQDRTQRDSTSHSSAQGIGNVESRDQEHGQSIAIERETDDTAEATTCERKASARVNVCVVKTADIDLLQDAMVDDGDDGEDPGDDLAKLAEREASDINWDDRVDVSEWLDASGLDHDPQSLAVMTTDNLNQVMRENELPETRQVRQKAKYEMRRALHDLLTSWDEYTYFSVSQHCKSDAEGPLLLSGDWPITKKAVVDGIQLVSTEAGKPMAVLDRVRLAAGDVLIDTIESLDWSSVADGNPRAGIPADTNVFNSLKHIRNGMVVVLEELEDQLEREAIEALLSTVEQAPSPQKAQPIALSTPKQATQESADIQWDPKEGLFNWTLYWEENGGSAEANRKYKGYMVSCTTRADVFNEWRMQADSPDSGRGHRWSNTRRSCGPRRSIRSHTSSSKRKSTTPIT
ncbi:hypothetical protein LTR53_004613 [Teratosphaeriaceae sp. CCFEE 6253]|nr:hypothetical protein LTR53_004613 [Teratosphaeriaceae sp. CCFEE 6253]